MARNREQRSKTPKVYTPLTDMDRRLIQAVSLGQVSYPPATGTKRFASEVQSAKQLTDEQRKFLWRIVWRFRRQISDREMVERAGHLREWANEPPAAAVAEPEIRVEPSSSGLEGADLSLLFEGSDGP